MVASNDSGSPDDIIEKWLKKLRELYGHDRRSAFLLERKILEIFLRRLIDETKDRNSLSKYELIKPFKVGGSGIVFIVSHNNIDEQKFILKFNRPREDGDAFASLNNEYHILPTLNHSNIIRVIDVGIFSVDVDGEKQSLIYLIEPFIANALDLNKYVYNLSLEDLHEINETSADNSLQSLISLLLKWVSAIKYVHDNNYVYLDIKPENAIVDKDGHLLVIDFGTAQTIDETDDSPTKIYFSEPYADPLLRSLRQYTASNDRVRASIKKNKLTIYFDYYALGKSILELLKQISLNHPHDFPQRPLFQSLHFIATRLLNGKNEDEKGIPIGKFIRPETFGGLEASDYESIKYNDLDETIRDLNKEYGSWNPETVVPELRTYPNSSLRMVPNINTVLTDRLLKLIEHPLIARLKLVNQLGLISLVYPTATHSRFDHIVGSYTYTASYIKSLYYDSDNCIFRNLINKNDVKEALLASILHDLGQYPLAHELTQVHANIFDHSSLSLELLDDDTTDKDGRTIMDIIQDEQIGWGVNAENLKRILGSHSSTLKLKASDVNDFKADMLSALIDGPIDASKADYIIRDSQNCRIPYGDQLDIQRLLSVLTTVIIPSTIYKTHKVTIGVYEKGRASASAFSLARYLLHASIYWHHTSRIIKSMLQYATAMILPSEVFTNNKSGKIQEIRENLISFIIRLKPPFSEIQEELESKESDVLEKISLVEKPPEYIYPELVKDSKSLIEKVEEGWYPGISTTDWLMLKWIKTIFDSSTRSIGVDIINSLQHRKLYKRICTLPRTKEYMPIIEVLSELTWPQKIELSRRLQETIYNFIIENRHKLETIPITHIDRFNILFQNYQVILIDIPNPKIAESRRPLIYMPEIQKKTYYEENITPLEDTYLKESLNSLYNSIAPVRILCHPEVRQWIGACIEQKDMMQIIEYALKTFNNPK